MLSQEEKNKIKKELEFGALQESELQSLSDLIKNMNDDGSGMFNLRSMEPEYYHWMYYRNPAGKATVYCARHNGKIIGTFAMAPKRMQIDGKEVLCGKTMDMFTNPDYQGLGLMSRLAGQVFEESKQQKMTMWYVTPSKNSYPIFKYKWNYIECFEIAHVTKFLDYFSVAASMIKSGFFNMIVGPPVKGIQKLFRMYTQKQNTYKVEEMNRFDTETDELWNKIRGDLKVALIRNSEYMNWRYIDNPDNYIIFKFTQDEQIQGILVLKITIRRGLKVGEILEHMSDAGDYKFRKLMIKYAIQYFRKKECAVCQSWVIDGSLMENEMRKSGLRYKRNKLKFLHSPEAPIEQFYDKNNWVLTQGDGNDV